MAELERQSTDKGEWLFCRIEERGKTLQELVFPILQQSLDRLPVAKPMRWADHDYSFVRPVHWLLVLHGSDVVPGTLYGHEAGRLTRGHRIHSPGPHELSSTSEYVEVLRSASVLVDPDTRRDRIESLAIEAGSKARGRTRITPAVLDEVNNLIEWPSAALCKFEPEFLEVPQEALIASMEDHQKFFPVLGEDEDQLLPLFVAITNLDSADRDAVTGGYERVIRPRLADARFFWEQDGKQPLDACIPLLDDIVFQQKLGSVGDKSRRVSEISSKIAEIVSIEPEPSARAALLAKCDLVSQMVGEFPELQGVMGAYYAEASGEEEAVCDSIREHYLPRYAGDALPGSLYGQILALADRLDTLVGIFSAGLQPTGNKDPFALRRAALGLVRILVEKDMRIELDDLLEVAAHAYPDSLRIEGQDLDAVREFIIDRSRHHFRELGFSTRLVNAALGAPVTTLPDLNARLLALREFMQLPEAESLVAANKRIGNILRKSEEKVKRDIDEDRLVFEEEKLLFKEVMRLEDTLEPLYEQSEYAPALRELAQLKETVAGFFDEVMVMDEDPVVRANRLALLGRLKRLFDVVAELSQAA